mmetsp:Transcript_4129/g.15984  ORF Transcript_4129/g.15984 Transcript_4129/m.15984 type:complete len:537 (+) Transcript_4129:344-1954(+)
MALAGPHRAGTAAHVRVGRVGRVRTVVALASGDPLEAAALLVRGGRRAPEARPHADDAGRGHLRSHGQLLGLLRARRAHRVPEGRLGRHDAHAKALAVGGGEGAVLVPGSAHTRRARALLRHAREASSFPEPAARSEGLHHDREVREELPRDLREALRVPRQALVLREETDGPGAGALRSLLLRRRVSDARRARAVRLAQRRAAPPPKDGLLPVGQGPRIRRPGERRHRGAVVRAPLHRREVPLHDLPGSLVPDVPHRRAAGPEATEAGAQLESREGALHESIHLVLDIVKQIKRQERVRHLALLLLLRDHHRLAPFEVGVDVMAHPLGDVDHGRGPIRDVVDPDPVRREVGQVPEAALVAVELEGVHDVKEVEKLRGHLQRQVPPEELADDAALGLVEHVVQIDLPGVPALHDDLGGLSPCEGLRHDRHIDFSELVQRVFFRVAAAEAAGAVTPRALLDVSHEALVAHGGTPLDVPHEQRAVLARKDARVNGRFRGGPAHGRLGPAPGSGEQEKAHDFRSPPALALVRAAPLRRR